MNLRFAIFLATIVSFISISMEILWVSVLGYMMKGIAGYFGLVLALLLFGIAFGAKVGYIMVQSGKWNVFALISKFLFLAGIINFLSFPIIGYLMRFNEVFFQLLFLTISIVSFLLGAIFPLLCNESVAGNAESVGQHTSWVYAGTILGSTAGPLITGFVLLDYFEIHIIITFFSVLCVLLSLFFKFWFTTKNRPITRNIVVNFAAILFMIFSSKYVYSNYFEMFHFTTDYTKDTKFKHIAYNKSGIITIVEDELGDIVYGGGVYDGRVNVDVEINSNGISRAYMIAALHENPKNILMIGLSTGAWAKVLSDYEKVEKITAIEINSQYLEIIKKYPEVGSILDDDKIQIHVDDGRRWLNRNPEEKFDMIIMNTSFYFREHSTNVLSKDFLEICKKSLNENGVLYYNSTGYRGNYYTAAHVFDYVVKHVNLVAASDNPINLSLEQKRQNFLEFRIGNQSIFEANENRKKIMEELINEPLPNIKKSILKEDLLLITDDNMASEYKADSKLRKWLKKLLTLDFKPLSN